MGRLEKEEMGAVEQEVKGETVTKVEKVLRKGS